MTEAIMSPSARVSSEVLAFASERGVAAYLPAVLEMTQRLFPNSQRLAAVIQDDPEIANERTLVLEVDVLLDVPQARAAHRRWNDALFTCCPAPLVCVFTLSMELLR
jgi:hypothetical protein